MKAFQFVAAQKRTIKWHRQHIMQKLQLHSLAEMVSLAERLGLIADVGHRNPEPE